MKTYLLALVAISCSSVGALTAAAPQNASQSRAMPRNVVWSVEEGVLAPECVRFDAQSNALFVSQIGDGGGTAKDGDGWISKLSLDGKVVKNKWVTGFSAPKGMCSCRGILWVSDIDRLVGINIEKAKVVHDITIAGAEFLNGVTCGPDGSIFVADTLGNRIHRYQDSKLTTLAEGEQLEHPNGLLVESGKLLIAAWGIDVDDQWVTKTAGRLLALDLKSGKVQPITKKPVGNLDGLVADGKGGYVLTDWMAGKVLRVSRGGKVTQIMACPKGVADFEYVADKNLLIIPMMLENTVIAVALGK